MRVLVYGGRDFNKLGVIWRALTMLHEKYGFTLVIDGGARGVDTIAHKWALHNNVPTVREHADWRKYGNAAGPIRNKRMITEHDPEMGIAFPGGTGTANMTSQCHQYGIPVKTVVVRNDK